MPRKRRGTPRPRFVRRKPAHFINLPAVYTEPNYMGCHTLRWFEEGVGNKRKDYRRTLSMVVRAVLDIGLREIGEPPPLEYFGRLNDKRFKKTRTVIRADQEEQLRFLATRGYSLNLAFNLALRRGLEQEEDVRRLLAFRRRYGERKTYAGESFRLSDADAYGGGA